MHVPTALLQASRDSSTALQHRATQTVFELIDTLKAWNNRAQRAYHQQSRSSGADRSGSSLAGDDDFTAAQAGFRWLMDRIPERVMADAAARVGAYARCSRLRDVWQCLHLNPVSLCWLIRVCV